LAHSSLGHKISIWICPAELRSAAIPTARHVSGEVSRLYFSDFKLTSISYAVALTRCRNESSRYSPTVETLKKPADAASGAVFVRFSVRFLTIAIFSLSSFRGSFRSGTMFTILTGANALACVVLAIYRRERPTAEMFTHWDEALGMAALCVGALVFL
jgi:hypothetical protein